MNIAVVGSGISGNLVSRLLATRHQVTLFEAANYPGGHTNSVEVATTAGSMTVDTGFMVFNRRTYPKFCRMLQLLNVDSQPSDMSFSVRCETTGLEYNGTSLNTLFAQRRNLLSPRFWHLLREIVRFNQAGTYFAERNHRPDDSATLGEFLDEHRFGKHLRRFYLVPMLAAIWSATPQSVEQLPARFILGFMHNHGLMQLRGRPQWRTIVGGAKNYVTKLLEPLSTSLRLNTPIRRIVRHADGVTVYPANGSACEFDGIVLATHANQSLALLADASPAERDVLGALPYQENVAVLHSDPAAMPVCQRAWASWNYRLPKQSNPAGQAASVTYDLNRLQSLPSKSKVFVTLNPVHAIDPQRIHRQINYQHPAYHLGSVTAQRRWSEINGNNRTWYCGAYWGYGFHEDGVNSALRVAESFGICLDDLVLPVIGTQPSDSQQFTSVG